MPNLDPPGGYPKNPDLISPLPPGGPKNAKNRPPETPLPGPPGGSKIGQKILGKIVGKIAKIAKNGHFWGGVDFASI